MIALSRSLIVTLALSVLAPASLAQDCSSLDVSVDGSLAAGSSLSIECSGSLPDAILFLVVGQELGQTCLPLGMGQLCLGVAFPALVVPVGVTDADGNLSLVIDVPASNALGDELQLHFQAVGVVVSMGAGLGMGSLPTIEACASNVASVTLH